MPTFEWIELLAKNELKMEESGEFDLYGSFDQKTILEEQTKGFLRELKRLAQEMATAFNAFRGDRKAVKVFQISGTEADFMVFRNTLKLIFSFDKPGEVSINFINVRGGLVEEKMNKDDLKNGDVIKATLGPFNEGVWQFKDHRVFPHQLVRYYMTEFIKNSVS